MKTRIQIGQAYGRLVVVSRAANDKHGKTRWACRCSCSKEVEVGAAELRNGDATSCGCVRLDAGRDLLGLRVGKLVVIDKVYNRGSRKWKCSCDCGKAKYLSSKDLDGKRYNSCGCSAGLPRIPNLERIINGIYKTYWRHCQVKGREFLLTKEEFVKLAQSPCYYCGGFTLRNHKRGTCKVSGFRKAEKINGVDRVDSSKGYTQDNAVPCCSMCNKMKMEFPLSLWLSQIEKIYRRHGNGLELGRSDSRGEETGNLLCGQISNVENPG